ncbi:MAG TPA: sugar phosphate nucleotidyltransferase [Chitinophagaceae bacterium]|jgi:NDP-sugar pyrophosphorylase family protein|nr:sugar phosphate nucleotidyltransferase [Chitinophagaceae bacterium]
MIFAAGLGTRFKPWTDTHPKALAPVHGKPLLQRNIEYLQQYGIRDVVVNVHHFADQVVTAVAESGGWGSNVVISDERDEVLETGGGLLKAKELLGDEPFLTLNADILTDLDLDGLLQFHRSYSPLITLAVSRRESSRCFLFNGEDRLCGWRNKKTGEEKVVTQVPGLVEKAYSTIALFEPAVFGLIPFTGKFSLVEVYLALAGEHKVLGYEHQGDRFIDVGKPDSVAEAERIFS